MSAKTHNYYTSIRLEALTEEEHLTLKEAGALHQLYPESTGIYEEDCVSRIDSIGQNGNEGSHYGDTVDYRVSGSDNPDGVDVFNDGEWKHIMGDSYTDKVKKAVEEVYDLPKDDMFVDDYCPSDCLAGSEDVFDQSGKYCRDPISPSHYQVGNTGVEAIDIIESVLTEEQYIGYLRGNILKYQLRANKTV